MNLQDAFLNQIRVAKTPVTVYLTEGRQLKGIVKGFDNFVIMLELSGRDNLVYKHAISTIAPQGPLAFFNAETAKPEEYSG